MIVMMDDDSDDEEKKDDGMLEHKGMAKRYAYLSFTEKKKKKKKRYLLWLSIYLILIKRPTIHQFHQSYLFFKRPRGLFYLFVVRVS